MLMVGMARAPQMEIEQFNNCLIERCWENG